MKLPRKQASAQVEWLTALEEIQATADRGKADAMIEEAAADVRKRLPSIGRYPAYGWSGGKDSMVIRLVAEAAGVSEAVLVITDLEYPEQLAWLTDHMPAGLEVVLRPWDLEWLSKHPEMLFPRDAATASRWFAGVQHWGQRRYCKDRGVDVLLMGRRRADGNYIGRGGADVYRDKDGFARWSPLADWSHEQVLYVLAAYEVPLAPSYFWPRGFRVGTGAWPARQWTESTEHGWTEVYEIDPTVVETAALVLPSAAAFLEGR